MYSDMSTWIIASSSPNRNSASVRASSVLPTPDGPGQMNEPVGRFGSLMPARARRGRAAAVLGAPALLELALLLRELALLVPEVRGLLELLRLDRRLLLDAHLLDLLLELAVLRRRAHRLDAHPRRGPVDEVDRLVGQVAVLDVAVGEDGGRA